MANRKKTKRTSQNKTPIIPYGHQSIDKKDINEVIKVLRSDYLTQGPKIQEFEKSLAFYCRAKYAVAVSSGTAALHMAYLTAGIGPGDEIITTPNTFVATTNMMLSSGAKPVFCDIRLDTYNIDENKIESLITDKTKAIVPVHFAGQPCEMDQILQIAKKHSLLVIEDAAHALGAKYKNKKIGSLSDMAIFSFHPVKSITTGEGGAILTNDSVFYQKLRSLRSHGIQKDENGFNVMTELGYNYRITDIQSGLGLSQLTKIDGFIKKRQQIFNWYKTELADIKNIILPVKLPHLYSSWHIYVIRTKNPDQRLPLADFLKKNGIGINFHYPAVYSHPYYRQNGYKNLKLSNEEIYHNSCITLPLYYKMTLKDVKTVSNLIKEFFEKVDNSKHLE